MANQLTGNISIQLNKFHRKMGAKLFLKEG